jgi:cobalamin synthase
MSLRNAFAYLTFVRVPPRARAPLTRSLNYFPWFAAAFGSLNVLGFLAASAVTPFPVACLVAVLLPEALAGFALARGAVEAALGIRTIPGHGFAPGFRGEARGYATAAVLLAAKWVALMLMPQDWRVRAAFVFPILGLCARTFAFLLDARRPRGPARAGKRAFLARRVRAGFLSASLLFLAFLFQPFVALALLAIAGAAAWFTLRPLRLGGSHAPGRLTLQAAALTSEVTEAAMLVTVAAASFLR